MTLFALQSWCLLPVYAVPDSEKFSEPDVWVGELNQSSYDTSYYLTNHYVTHYLVGYSSRNTSITTVSLVKFYHQWYCPLLQSNHMVIILRVVLPFIKTYQTYVSMLVTQRWLRWLIIFIINYTGSEKAGLLRFIKPNGPKKLWQNSCHVNWSIRSCFTMWFI